MSDWIKKNFDSSCIAMSIITFIHLSLADIAEFSLLATLSFNVNNKKTVAPSEDSDPPGHLPNLIKSLRCPHEEILGR